MIIERLLLIALLIILLLAAYYIFKVFHMQRVGLVTAVADQPTLLYFSSERCTICPAQTRFVEQLADMWYGRIAIQKIDAEQQPDKAVQYKVFTLPTTILIDQSGAVREINYGLTHSRKLNHQLEKLSNWQTS